MDSDRLRLRARYTASMRLPQFSGAKARARSNHRRLQEIARTDFGGGFLIEPFGWLTAWEVALWPTN